MDIITLGLERAKQIGYDEGYTAGQLAGAEEAARLTLKIARQALKERLEVLDGWDLKYYPSDIEGALSNENLLGYVEKEKEK